MSTNPKRVILTISFLIVLILNVIVTIDVSNKLRDDDTSGEMLLSKCLYDEKSLICSDWEYATEVRVANQIIFAPLFGIFSEWSTVRIIGTLIIQSILLLSFVFMMISAGLRTDSILFGLSLLMLPYCVAYGRITLYHSYYTLYISTAFFISAFFFRVLNKTNSIISLTFLIFLCFLSSLNGMRIMFICVLPLCLLCMRAFITGREKLIFRLMFLCGISSLAGFILYVFVISKLFRLNTNNIRLSFKGISEVYIVLFSVMRQFAYRSGISRSSFLGVMSLAGIAVTVYGVCASGKAFFTEKEDNKWFLKAMLFVQLSLTSAALLFYQLPFNSRYDYSRYLVPASVWIIPLFCVKFEEQKTTFQKFCFYIVLAIFTANGMINLCFFQNTRHFTQDYDGLSYYSTGKITRFDDAIEFIRNEGYELGYTFEDSNSLSEYMNGFPVIGISYQDGKLFYTDWLARKSLRSIQANKVFLITNLSEAKTFRGITLPEESELVFTDKDFLFLFDIKDHESFKSYLNTEKK